MPKVLNKHKSGVPANAVYIGRPTKWGNPFVIGIHGTRHEVVAKYKSWLLNNPHLIEQARIELTGKDLVCFCAPLLCHGDVLLEIANIEVARMTHETLLNDAIAIMSELHNNAELDEDGENVIISPADWRKFVDAHAKLLYERKKLSGK